MSKVFGENCWGGFPFNIPVIAEDGEPFSEWDGATLYKSPGGAYQPSKSSSELITVYGGNSYFCIPLTLSQLAEMYWRARWVKVVPPASLFTGGAADASASGGTHRVINGETVWVPDYASAYAHNDGSLSFDGFCMIKRDTAPGFGGAAKLVVNGLTLGCSVYDSGDNLLRTGDGMYFTSGNDDTDAGYGEYGGSYVTAYCSWGGIIGDSELDGTYVSPNSGNVIKVGNGYWYAPAAYRYRPNDGPTINTSVRPIRYAWEAYATANGSTESGTEAQVAEADHWGAALTNFNGKDAGGADVDLSKVSIVGIPFDVVLSSGTISGGSFAQTYKLENGYTLGTAVNINITDAIFSPGAIAVDFTAATWNYAD